MKNRLKMAMAAAEILYSGERKRRGRNGCERESKKEKRGREKEQRDKKEGEARGSESMMGGWETASD